MFFATATPSTKEQTMKRIATTLVVAVVACLAFSSIASAHRSARGHANVQPGPCSKTVAKAAQLHVARIGHHHAAF